MGRKGLDLGKTVARMLPVKWAAPAVIAASAHKICAGFAFRYNGPLPSLRGLCGPVRVLGNGRMRWGNAMPADSKASGPFGPGFVHRVIGMYRADPRFVFQNTGYALYCAWTFILLFGIPSLYMTEADLPVSLTAFFAACALAGLAMGVVGCRVFPLYAKHAAVVIVGALGLVGILLSLAGGADRWLAAFGFALSGLCYTLLVCTWLELFVLQGLDRVIWNYLVGMFAGAMLYCGVASLVPGCLWLVGAVCPLGSALLVRPAAPCGERAPAVAPDAPAVQQGEERHRVSVIVRLLAVVALVSFSMGAVRAFAQGAGQAGLFYGSAALLPVVLQALASIVAKLIVSRDYVLHMPVVFYVALSSLAVGALGLLHREFSLPIALGAFSLTILSSQLMSFLVVFRIAEEYEYEGRGALANIGWLNVALSFPPTVALFVVPALDATGVTVAVILCALAAALVVMGDANAFSLSGHAAAPDDGGGRMRRIEALSSRFGLTPRESEVLELWGSGHSSPYIEKQLSITKNTVKTHTTHIYEKTGAASKEELLQLIDSMGEAGRR